MWRLTLTSAIFLLLSNALGAQSSTVVTVTGVPLSVVYTARPFQSSYSNISIVLVVDGEQRIASANTNSPGVAQLTHMVALLEAEIADGDEETITIVGEEYTPTAPEAVYANTIFVRLSRIDISGYSWGKLYLQ